MPSRWWREIDVATESLTPRIQRGAEGRRFFQGVSLLNLFICRRVSAALYIILPLGGLFYQHTETTTDDAGRSLNYSSAVHFRCDEFLSNRNYSNQNKHAKHSEMVGRLKLTPCVRPPVDAEAWLGPPVTLKLLQPQRGHGVLAAMCLMAAGEPICCLYMKQFDWMLFDAQPDQQPVMADTFQM